MLVVPELALQHSPGPTDPLREHGGLDPVWRRTPDPRTITVLRSSLRISGYLAYRRAERGHYFSRREPKIFYAARAPPNFAWCMVVSSPYAEMLSQRPPILIMIPSQRPSGDQRLPLTCALRSVA